MKKINEPSKYEAVYELTKDLDDFHVKGRQYGKKEGVLWTPDGETGRTVPADEETIAIALHVGFFKELPARKNRRKG